MTKENKLFTRNTYIDEFSRLDRTFRKWHWVVLFPKLFPRVSSRGLRKSFRSIFILRVRSLKYENSLISNGDGFPDIEVLSVVAGKDLITLPYTLKSVLKNSLNPIAQITIVCPKAEIDACASVLKRLDISTPIRILDEDHVVPESTRSAIKAKFPHRYWWVLQQFLAIKFISESTKQGVLLINADTILIKKAHWLNASGKQILLPSLDFHLPYYKLLGKFFKFTKHPTHTFVTHHMLFQPLKFAAIFKKRGFKNVEEFSLTALELSDANESSPLCVEFEPYAQGMMADYLDFVSLRKFSNLGLPRTPENLKLIDDLIEAKVTLPYNSISLHDYL